MKKLGIRFSVGFLLFVAMWVGGFLSGWRYGVVVKQQSAYDQTVKVVAYDLSDLIEADQRYSTRSHLSRISRLISETLEGETLEGETLAGETLAGEWSNPNLNPGIIEHPAARSLIVEQSGKNHRRIDELLKELRLKQEHVVMVR